MCEAMRRLMEDEIADEVKEAKMEEKRDMDLSLADMGMPAEKIAKVAKVSVNLFQEWLSGSVSMAK